MAVPQDRAGAQRGAILEHRAEALHQPRLERLQQRRTGSRRRAAAPSLAVVLMDQRVKRDPGAASDARR
jgi:hypothetical protein